MAQIDRAGTADQRRLAEATSRLMLGQGIASSTASSPLSLMVGMEGAAQSAVGLVPDSDWSRQPTFIDELPEAMLPASACAIGACTKSAAAQSNPPTMNLEAIMLRSLHSRLPRGIPGSAPNLCATSFEPTCVLRLNRPTNSAA